MVPKTSHERVDPRAKGVHVRTEGVHVRTKGAHIRAKEISVIVRGVVVYRQTLGLRHVPHAIGYTHMQ